MSVTATAPRASPAVTDRRPIRPPDPQLGTDTGLRIGRYSSVHRAEGEVILTCSTACLAELVSALAGAVPPPVVGTMNRPT